MSLYRRTPLAHGGRDSSGAICMYVCMYGHSDWEGNRQVGSFVQQQSKSPLELCLQQGREFPRVESHGIDGGVSGPTGLVGHRRRLR